MNVDLDTIVSKIEANDWALTYLMPGFYDGGFIPEESVYPTSSQVIDFDRVFSPSPDGKFLALFSPVIEAFISHAPILGLFENLPQGIPEAYRVYCDNNGLALPVTGNLLNNASSWPYNKQPSTDLLQYYKKLRVIGAAISVEVTDIIGDYRGIVESCEYFQIAGSHLSGDEIDITKLNKYPRYSVNSVNQKIGMRYRKNSSKLDHFGPYEPFTTIPFFLFSGTGLSPNASIHVSFKVHVEGVLLPALVHFSTNTTRNYMDRLAQINIIEEFEKGEADLDETITMLSKYSQGSTKVHMSNGGKMEMDLPDEVEWLIPPWGIVKPTLKPQKVPKIKIDSNNKPSTRDEERAALKKYALNKHLVAEIRSLSNEQRAILWRYQEYIEDSKMPAERYTRVFDLTKQARYWKLSDADKIKVERHVAYGARLFEADEGAYDIDYSDVDRLNALDAFFASKYSKMTVKEERELIERAKKQSTDDYNNKMESRQNFFELATNAARSLYNMSQTASSLTKTVAGALNTGLRTA